MSVLKFRQTKKYTIENIPTKIKCDFCDKLIKGDYQKDHCFYRGGKVEIVFGYGSKYDGYTSGKIHICDDCAEKLFEKKAKALV